MDRRFPYATFLNDENPSWYVYGGDVQKEPELIAVITRHKDSDWRINQEETSYVNLDATLWEIANREEACV